MPEQLSNGGYPTPQEPLHVHAQRVPVHELQTGVGHDGLPVIEDQPAGPMTGELAALNSIFEGQNDTVIEPVAVEGPRHASDEIAPATDNISRVGRHSVEAQHQVPEAPARDRLLVRTFNRLSNFADKHSEKWNDRRTTREFAGNQVERGRDAARRVGASVVASAQSTKENLSTRYHRSVEKQRNNVLALRGAVVSAGRSALERKDALVTRAMNRMDKVEAGVRSGAEKAGRAVKIGGEVLAVSGIVIAQSGVMAAEAVGRGAKSGARKTVEGARMAGTVTKEFASGISDEVVDLRAANAEYRAMRADPQHKAEKQANKHARRAAKAQELRAKSEQKTLHRMTEAEIAEARAKALNR
jgi:hypothetical protein